MDAAGLLQRKERWDFNGCGYKLYELKEEDTIDQRRSQRKSDVSARDQWDQA